MPKDPVQAGVAQLPQTVPECHAVIALLIERVKLLEERINLDSNNSSKPPSSNGPGTPNRAQRRASDRKRGAQPGHKGHSRAMLDESEVLCPPHSGGCEHLISQVHFEHP